MNITPFNPDSWMDFAVLIFFGVCSVITAGLPLWMKVRKIDEQVSNSHTENLRDEITRGFREVQEALQLIRSEQHLERQERIAGDQKRGCARDC